jgi:hypothetical protein
VQSGCHSSSANAGRSVTVETEEVHVPIIDRENIIVRRRARRLEEEVEELNQRLDALVEAVNRMARQHYRYPLLPENSLSSALHDARRR